MKYIFKIILSFVFYLRIVTCENSGDNSVFLTFTISILSSVDNENISG